MGLLGWLRRNTPNLDTAGLPESLIRDATDYVARLCDPRLHLVSRYREQLAPAVTQALRFVQTQRSELDTPLRVSTETWYDSPLLRALFSSPEDMFGVLGRSYELVEWFARNPLTDEAIITLGMTLHEQQVYGLALQGEIVQHDVAQTTLNFSDHRARIFSDSLETLWRGVARRFIDELAYVALSRIEAEQARRKSLEDDLALLRTRVRTLERRGVGVDNLLAGGAVSSQEARRLLRQLAHNEQELNAMTSGQDLLERRLAILAEVLQHPEQHIQIERRQRCLDRLNHVVPEGSPESNRISFVCVRVARTPPIERALVVLQVPRSAMQATHTGLRLDEAARLLNP